MVIGISTLRIEITKDVSDSFLSLIEGGYLMLEDAVGIRCSIT